MRGIICHTRRCIILIALFVGVDVLAALARGTTGPGGSRGGHTVSFHTWATSFKTSRAPWAAVCGSVDFRHR
jgi:hypothetical protein